MSTRIRLLISLALFVCITLLLYDRHISVRKYLDSAHSAVKTRAGEISGVIQEKVSDWQEDLFHPNLRQAETGPNSNSSPLTNYGAPLNATLPTWNTSAAYLTFGYNPRMGLGNAMFLYAALFGLARYNDRLPIIDISDRRYPLIDWFTLSIPELDIKSNVSNLTDFTPVKYETCCKAAPHLFHLPPDNNLQLIGYFQSYKYFESSLEQIRATEFRFQPHIKTRCERSLRVALRPRLEAITSCMLIGVHARRGDFTHRDKMAFGHVPARKEYLAKAVDYFRRKFEKVPCVRFIVLGNDRDWNERNMPSDSDVIVLEPDKSPVHDLCVLASCNHTIQTTGTFSWWSAFLANGLSTYQLLFARPASSLAEQYIAEQFFLPHWVAL